MSMDPKALIKDEKYVLQHNSEIQKLVFYVHETINYYVFLSEKELINLTSSAVNTQISKYSD